ncbi:retrovirus-related pol polyprotein from transposon TNT 1-94 [Tanacetum coccineum]
MHNNIMAAGSKDRPPMLGPGRYSQWRSRFLRYLNTKSNGEYLRKCIFEGPYTITSVLIAVVKEAENEQLASFNNASECSISSLTPTSTRMLPSTRPSATTRHKGKEIAKPVTPQSESVSEEDSDPEQARRDKDMKKNLALLAKYFKKLCNLPTNNLIENIFKSEKTEYTTPRQSGLCCITTSIGVTCFNCKGFGHLCQDCRKAKAGLKDFAYHKEKDDKDDSNVIPDSSNICTNDNQVDQNAAECVDERVALANLTLDTEENKTVLKQLKKANASLTQELKGVANLNLDEIIVNQKHDELVKKSLLTRSQFEGQLKEKSKVISDLKVKEGKDIDTMIEMDKQIKFLNEILYKRNQSIQTIHMLAPKCATYNGRSTFANPKYLKKAQSDKPCLYEIPYDTSDPANRFCPNGGGKGQDF